MKRNLGSVLVVIVGVILAVDVAIRLAPQEANAQHISDATRQLSALMDIAEALEKANIRREHARKSPDRWATDMEIGHRQNYYILWSTGEVTDGGTLP